MSEPARAGEGNAAPHLLLLVGFMGSGKSRVAREVALRLGRPVLDIDELVEQATGRSVAELIESGGEAAFRRRELAALEAVEVARAPVIAAGGGLFTCRAAREWVRRYGRSVWLDAPLELCRERVGAGAGRPLWAAEPLALRALYERRRAVYALADLRVPVGHESLGRLAERLARALGPTKVDVFH